MQIRGYKIAFPLDIFIIATVNPEDYTSRGRIITLLKDRFGAQIRTHYSRTLEEEVDIVRQERAPFTADGLTLKLPHFMEEIIAEISQMARRKSEINHYSGISVHMSIHNMENLISNDFRRAIRLNEKEVVPRITDLIHLSSSMKGKIEWDFIEGNAEEEKIKILIRDAVSKIFRHLFSQDSFANSLKEFSAGDGIEVSEMTSSPFYLRNIEAYPSLKVRMAQLTEDTSSAARASAVEFILEGYVAPVVKRF